MKTTLLFLCISLWGVAATSYSQTHSVTLKIENGTIREVLDAIEE